MLLKDRAGDVKLWYFPCCWIEQSYEQIVPLTVTCDAMAPMWRHSSMWRNELYHILPANGFGGGRTCRKETFFISWDKIQMCTFPSTIENIEPFNDPSAQRASNAKNASIWWRHHIISLITNCTQAAQADYPGRMCDENWIVNPRPCFTM